jgi:DNA-binding SARP family transcriptional activator
VWELERGDTLLSSRAVIASKIQAPSAPALPRERIAAQLGALWTHRFGLIVAPAGYGKTTAMTVFAASAGVPVAWYRVEAWDADEASLLLHLETALRRALPEVAGPWMTLPEAVASLEEAISAPALLVIDDVHTIEGTAAETVLERFIEYAPEALAILVASRSQPHVNLPRLRVLGRVVELGVDDLRFRTWEVEQLFRDFYGQPMGPHELAELARRTDGWAAGLHLFHLATRNRSGDERSSVLGALGSRSRMIREFLTSNVLDQLPAELREFLVATSVLGVLNGQLCDWYLGRQGSQAILLELHRRRLFTQALDGESSFRYHEVLRAHLEGVLVDEVGEEAVQEACHRAGSLLEEVGAVPEALRAYSRAGDADAVARLLGRKGAALADQPGHWLESLPPALLENDPWLLLALARRHRAGGHTNAALDAYRRAEAGFAGRAIADVCRDERLRLQSWVTPESTHPREGHWSGGLRAILETGGENRSTRPSEIRGALAALIASLADLIDGRLTEARERGLELALAPDATHDIAAAGLVIAGTASLCIGDPAGLVELRRAEDQAESAGAGWIARLARAARSLSACGDPPDTAAAVTELCMQDGDRWGAAFALLCEGAGRRVRGDPSASLLLLQAGDRFHELRAARLQRLAREVEAGSWPPDRGSEVPAPSRAAAMPSMPAGPVIDLRCFGRLSATVNGHVINLNAVKPRVRSLLRLLGAQGGAPVHREVICEALWPEADPTTGLHNLQVAVSSLRRLLEPGVSRGGGALIVRDADSYRLALPGASTCDVVTYRRLLSHARETVATEPATAAADFTTAASMLRNGLLPEEGPAEWAEVIRERCRADAAATGLQLAERAVLEGDPATAAAICTETVSVDRYLDPAWRLLIAVQQQRGDDAGAAQARRRYGEVLLELGVHDSGATHSEGIIATAR